MRITPCTNNNTYIQTTTRKVSVTNKPLLNNSVSFGAKVNFSKGFDACLQYWLLKNKYARNEWGEVIGKNKDLIKGLKKDILEAAKGNCFVDNVKVSKPLFGSNYVVITGNRNNTFGFVNYNTSEPNYVKVLTEVKDDVEKFQF